MTGELLVSRVRRRIWAAIREGGRTAELRVTPPDDLPCEGRVVKARVTRVVPGLQAAFLDVGAPQAALLPASAMALPGERPPLPSIERRLREGRELLVQIERGARRGKGARATTAVRLPGRRLVLLTGSTRRAISRRIRAASERRELQAMLDTLPGDDVGYLARTAARGTAAARLRDEAHRLLGAWRAIGERAATVTAPGVVQREASLLEALLRDAPPGGFEAIVVDDAADRQAAADYLLQTDPESVSRIRLHGPAGSLWEDSIAAEVLRALRPRVWLDSGGFLTIEQTEALVSVDVNTGKYLGRGDLQATLLRTNLEAAARIPRELRRRGLAGVVVVDWADMPSPDAWHQVRAVLERELREDPARTRLLGLSDVGLLQLTRERLHASLAELVTETCAACGGTGRTYEAQ